MNFTMTINELDKKSAHHRNFFLNLYFHEFAIFVDFGQKEAQGVLSNVLNFGENWCWHAYKHVAFKKKLWWTYWHLCDKVENDHDDLDDVKNALDDDEWSGGKN